MTIDRPGMRLQSQIRWCSGLSFDAAADADWIAAVSGQRLLGWCSLTRRSDDGTASPEEREAGRDGMFREGPGSAAGFERHQRRARLACMHTEGGIRTQPQVPEQPKSYMGGRSKGSAKTGPDPTEVVQIRRVQARVNGKTFVNLIYGSNHLYLGWAPVEVGDLWCN